MSTSKQVSDLEGKLRGLSRRYKRHSKEAQETIDANQAGILRCLRGGVKLIQTVVQGTQIAQKEREDDRFLISLDCVPTHCPGCRRELDGLYLECHTCLTYMPETAHETIYCLSCGIFSPPCHETSHYPALRSTTDVRWAQKVPLPWSKLLNTSWLRCDFCATLLKGPENTFSWCLTCIKERNASWCARCTSYGKRCTVGGHEKPTSGAYIIESRKDIHQHLEKVSKKAGVSSVVTRVVSPGQDEEASVVEKCQQIINCFTELENAADRQISDITDIQLAAIGIEDELTKLAEGVEETTEKTLGAVANLEKSLEITKGEGESAQKRLDAAASEIEEKNSELEDKKDKKKFMRVAQIGAMIATPIFLPAIGVAAGLQVLGMVNSVEIAELKSKKAVIESEQRTVEAKLEALKEQNETLQDDLSTSKGYQARCEHITNQLEHTNTRLKGKIIDNQVLKEASSKFVLWTTQLKSRAELMEDVDDSRDFDRMVKRLIEDLMVCRASEVVRICRPLRKLLSNAETGS